MSQTTSNPAPAQDPPSLDQPILDSSMSLRWMHATHYHCKECGAEIVFWGCLGWRGTTGVRRVGACKFCDLVMIESENEGLKWIKI